MTLMTIFVKKFVKILESIPIIEESLLYFGHSVIQNYSM